MLIRTTESFIEVSRLAVRPSDSSTSERFDLYATVHGEESFRLTNLALGKRAYEEIFDDINLQLSDKRSGVFDLRPYLDKNNQKTTIIAVVDHDWTVRVLTGFFKCNVAECIRTLKKDQSTLHHFVLEPKVVVSTADDIPAYSQLHVPVHYQLSPFAVLQIYLEKEEIREELVNAFYVLGTEKLLKDYSISSLG